MFVCSTFTLALCSYYFAFVLSNMSLFQSDQAEFEEIEQRLRRLNTADRRRTLDRLQARLSAGEDGFSHRDSSAHVNPTTVVVEQSDKKLPPFSGADKVSNGEVSFKRWLRAAERVRDDDSLSFIKRRQVILKSLRGEADDIADQYKNDSAADIIDVLEKKYGGTIDGEDLLLQFYQCVQTDSQSASEYLSKLFVDLGEVVKHSGLHMGDMSRVLLKQFIRNTTDEDLLLKLRLEDKVDDPPNFPDLISAIRREESRRTERRLRQKKAKSQGTTVASVSQVQPDQTSEVIRLQQRVAELEEATVYVEPPQPDGEVARLQQRVAMLEQRLSQVNRYIFCYRCGQDAHKATECNNPANESLVQQKVNDRRKRQQQQRLNMK